MRRLVAFLIMMITLFSINVCSLAEEYEVGGSSLEDCVQRMPGYVVETTENGAKIISITELSTEYFITESENGIAVMPMLVAVGNLHLHNLAIAPPVEFSTVERFVIYTDKNKHDVVLNKPWVITSEDTRGQAIIANEEMDAVLDDVYSSEYVSIEFYQDNQTSLRVDLTEEQKFLLRQYNYTCDTYLKKADADPHAKENAFIMGILAGSGMFPYTITSEATVSSDGSAVNQNTSSSVSEAADEIRELKALLEEGLITQEEYDAKKKQLLGL